MVMLVLGKTALLIRRMFTVLGSVLTEVHLMVFLPESLQVVVSSGDVTVIARATEA